LAEILQPVTIAGWTGEIVQWPASLAAGHATESPGQEAPAKSMRIARVAAGAHAWYFKLEGPAARVSESAESFREFLLNTTRQ